MFEPISNKSYTKSIDKKNYSDIKSENNSSSQENTSLRLIKKLGRGGQGVVEQYHDDKNNQSYAVKSFKSAQCLEDELSTYKKVGLHENIIQCLGTKEINGKKTLILEY